MTSQIVKYHPTDPGIALLFDPDKSEYWIGEYDPFLTHQTSEPSYTWAAGNWTSLEEAELLLILWV
jgi:hypothetical protein